MHDPPKLSRLVIDSVSNPHVGNALIDLGESILDASASLEVYRSVPVIGTIVGIFSTMRDLRERLFLARLVRFLQTAQLGEGRVMSSSLRG